MIRPHAIVFLLVLVYASAEAVVWLQDPGDTGCIDAQVSDNFNRADESDVAGWAETEPVNNCDINIASNELQFHANNNPQCDTEMYIARYDTNIGDDDGYAQITFRSQTIPPHGNRGGWGFRFRMGNNSVPENNNHYAVFCEDAACGGDVTWAIRTSATVPAAASEEIESLATNCLGALSSGDIIGIKWTGTGDATEVDVWNHGTSDPGDPDTWSTPADCEFRANPGANAVDSGLRVGFGLSTGNASNGQVVLMDDFEAGECT